MEKSLYYKKVRKRIFSGSTCVVLLLTVLLSISALAMPPQDDKTRDRQRPVPKSVQDDKPQDGKKPVPKARLSVTALMTCRFSCPWGVG